MRVDTHLLRTFVAVASLGSFSAAATELGYTQAAVSQQIAALEADLKVTLLSRRPVSPTEAGARLLEHAEPILLRLDAARADVGRITQVPAAAVTIGVTPLAAAASLAGDSGLGDALLTLRRRMPRLDITVRVLPRIMVATLVARGQLDAGLLDGLAAEGDSLTPQLTLNSTGIVETGVSVMLPADHPLAGRNGLRLPDLADARWIEAPDVAPPLSEIQRFAGVDGFRAAILHTGTDIMSLIKLAAAGHGLTLLPATPRAPGDFAAVPVTTPRIVHRVELIHGALREGSPAAVLGDILASS